MSPIAIDKLPLIFGSSSLASSNSLIASRTLSIAVFGMFSAKDAIDEKSAPMDGAMGFGDAPGIMPAGPGAMPGGGIAPAPGIGI